MENTFAFDFDGRQFISRIESETSIARNKVDVWHTCEVIGEDVEAFRIDIIQSDTPDQKKREIIANGIRYCIDHADVLAA